MTSWPAWRERDAPGGLLQYVLPDEVKRLMPGGLPGPSHLKPLERLRQVYDAFVGAGIRYAHEAPLAEAALQVIRPPDQVLWQPRHGTCLDLAVTFSGACLVAGLHPWIVVVEPSADQDAPRHALALVWLEGSWLAQPDDSYPSRHHIVWTELPELVEGELRDTPQAGGHFVAVDPTTACRQRPDGTEPASFEASVLGAADKLSGGGWRWVTGLDVGLGWREAGTLTPPGRPETLPLRDPYLDPPPDAGPLELTRPEYKVVPFQERDELRALLHWCEES